jgi:endoglucanase
MKRCLLLLLLVSQFAVHAQSSKFVTVKGKQVIGTDGKPMLIRGTNLGNWLVPEGYMFKLKNVNSAKKINEAISELIGPDEAKAFWKKFLTNYITEADIHYLKSLGMNSIRVPFHYKLFTSEEYLGEQNPNHGFQLLDKLIDWCRKENLYVILDMHCAPGGQTGDNIDDSFGYPFLFESPESRKLTIDIWKRIAAHYKNEPMVLGYDLLNEPIATYFDSSKLNHFLEPLYKEIVQGIRQTDNNHIVFLGGAQWDSNFRIFGQPFDNKTVYTFHKYWTEPTQKVIQDYIDFSNRYNVPIYIGETGENKDEWIDAFRKVLEQNNIGWHFWPYKKMTNKAGIVEFPMPENYDLFINYAETPRPNFEAIRKARPENIDTVKKALEGFLNNCKFENCTPNKGYISALGLGNNQL